MVSTTAMVAGTNLRWCSAESRKPVRMDKGRLRPTAPYMTIRPFTSRDRPIMASTMAATNSTRDVPEPSGNTPGEETSETFTRMLATAHPQAASISMGPDISAIFPAPFPA